MKTRNGFVSNSSSSSFVIIGEGPQEQAPGWILNPDSYTRLEIPMTLILGDAVGETEFGWGPEHIRGMGSRLNLAWVLSEQDEDHRYELIRAIRERYPHIVDVEFHSRYSYVDHQSVDSMADEVFRDDETLRAFLFNIDSEIHLDNDNR